MTDWTGWIGLVAGVGGLIVAALSWRETKKSSAANQDMATANKAMASSSEVSARAALESATASKEMVELQTRINFQTNHASLEIASPTDLGKPMRSVLDQSLVIHTFVRNKGPAWANHVKFTASYLGMRFESEAIERVGPNTTEPLDLLLGRSRLPEELPDIDFELSLTFEDGNGLQSLSQVVQLNGHLGVEPDVGVVWITPA